MIRLILTRIMQAIPVLFIVASLTFVLLHLAPGGPFDGEKRVSVEMQERLNAYYHLEQPLWNQYRRYIQQLLVGDLGPSYRYPTHSVNELIATGFAISAELALYALLFALIVGITTGSIAALGANSWRDHSAMGIAMVGICVPTFLLAPILVLIFSIHLQWLPVAAWGLTPGDKILPTISLGAVYAAYIARLSRGGILEVIHQDYIRNAYAKGLPKIWVLIRHTLQGGLAPVVSFLGPALAGLISGSFVIETLFHIPGLGRFYVQAAFNRDYSMVLGTTLFFTLLILLFNLLADIIALRMDPRIRDNKRYAN